MDRRCGGCTLCCRLLPTKEINKPANQRCPHQRTGKGCAAYAHRPVSCQVWTCRWLANDDTADLRRPDRARYVIDVMPDYITVTPDGGEPITIPVIQVWMDPAHPDAHQDPGLRAYVDRRGHEGYATIVRSSSVDAFVLFPPSMSADGQWHEERSGVSGEAHSAAEILTVLEGVEHG